VYILIRAGLLDDELQALKSTATLSARNSPCSLPSKRTQCGKVLHEKSI